jgi:hypothetical protein
VRVTEIDVGMPVIDGRNEGDTAPTPMILAPMPSGGTRLAWLSSYTRNGTSALPRLHVAELDCEDRLVGAPFSFEAYDFSDIAADENGGVLLLTRDSEGSGDQNCGDVNDLCGVPPDRPGCYEMYMVRFDNAGREVWSTKLTTGSAETPPYTSGGAWNYFIWWYQHHGRLAFDGMNYAAYFCTGITVQNGSCVDIHEGDRMQVVGPGGAIVPGRGSFDGGCSHSWNTRIVWDERFSHFVMVCATDNPRAGGLVHHRRGARPDHRRRRGLTLHDRRPGPPLPGLEDLPRRQRRVPGPGHERELDPHRSRDALLGVGARSTRSATFTRTERSGPPRARAGDENAPSPGGCTGPAKDPCQNRGAPRRFHREAASKELS